MIRRRSPGAQRVALWRFSVIEEVLDPALTPRGRAELVLRIARTPLLWPSGVARRVSRATLYRWIDAYQERGLKGLRPRPRRDRGKRRRKLPTGLLESALRHLATDPHQPLPFLIAVLEAELEVHHGKKVRIPRSTLQRRLAATAAYQRLRRERSHARRRRRFVASSPHDLWQCDAKGPFPVRIATGETVEAHVLSILDDATRAILAAHVVESPTLAAAIRVFRQAVLRWGICAQFYADRASIFDSHAFRAGLAELGASRIPTKPGNAPARGKIEAYHRTIAGSFARRLLAAQVVVDFVHLQQLLDAVIHRYYMPKRHRGIQVPPETALAGRTSSRTVPPARLIDAFREERPRVAHRVTGEVELQDATWIVPDELRGTGRKLCFLLDPAREAPPVVMHPRSGRHLSLRRAAVRPGDVAAPEPVRWKEGPLQTLYDAWRGQRRPQAQPGFGLPEVYALLAKAAGRHVPASDAESAAVQRAWRTIGPLARRPTEKAMAAIATQLGPGRPIKSYLDALAARIAPPSEAPARRKRKKP